MSEQAQVNFRRSPAIPSYNMDAVVLAHSRAYRTARKDRVLINARKLNFRSTIRWFEKVTGKKSLFPPNSRSKRYRDYIASFTKPFVDRTGFLKTIGVKSPLYSFTRKHEDHAGLVEHYYGYMSSKYCSKSVAVKAWHYFMFAAWQKYPKEIAKQVYMLSSAVQKEMKEKPWLNMTVPNPPLTADKAFVLPNVVAEKFPGFYKQKSPIAPAFYEGEVHQGVVGAKYGTYAIAVSEGYPPKFAKAMGIACANVDRNDTDVYGKTNDTESRHFNLNAHDSNLPDTRIIWGKRHFEAAVVRMQHGDFKGAALELGVALHSLQDMGAHGQIPLGTHKILGFVPDIVEYNPVGLSDAMTVTRALLREFKKRVQAFVPPRTVKILRSSVHSVRI